MNTRTSLHAIGWALCFAGSLCSNAGIFVDTTPGTAAPPGTLGGYSMGGFPVDLTPEGTMINALAPPLLAPVAGNLTFNAAVEHDIIGSYWATWSHGYVGDVYAYYGQDSQLLMMLPAGTMAFSLYVEPNIFSTFEFEVDSGAAVATLNIDGYAGAKYVGFYSDDPLQPLQYVYVKQTTLSSDGFAVGEFMINVVPEPQTWGLVAGLGLAVLGVARRFRR
jgi:hypothetical protein